jgi:phosphonopyruvate decarboxylase
VLMRLGALATLGAVRAPNLVHLLLDNAMHESTGGQSTVSPVIDFCAIAQACGYARVQRLAEPGEVAAALHKSAGGLSFIHIPILPGIPSRLPRPRMLPAQVAQRFAAALGPRQAGGAA